MPRRARNQSGYSLLELMITVVIIGVLTGLALPAVRSGMRDRRKMQATQEVVRIIHRTRSRAIASGRAHMVRFSGSANSGQGGLFVVRGNTNRCTTSTFPTSNPSATSCGTDRTLVCQDWWVPSSFEVAGGGYSITLARVAGLDASATAASVGDLDLCFDGSGTMYARTNTASRFSDIGPDTGGYVFLVRALVGSTDPGVVRRVVVPFGGEARLVQ